MAQALRTLVAWFSRAHDTIMTLNDTFETHFTDKQLHFLVVGGVGLLLILAIYPLFRLLASRHRVLAITWIYVLTVLLVLTFAIEIGQRVTGTGSMDFADIVAGMGGFFAVTAALVALRLVAWAGKALLETGKRRTRARQRARA